MSSLLEERSVFPVPVPKSSTCKLDRCAKELSSTASTDRRLNLDREESETSVREMFFPHLTFDKNSQTIDFSEVFRG